MKFLTKFSVVFFVLFANIFLQSNTPSKYVIGFWLGGMGAGLTSTLKHLAYCEKHNLTPVIYWYKGLYYNPNGFNGKQNEWEYYFKPVSHLKYNQGDTVNRYLNDEQGSVLLNYYDTSQEKRDFAYNLVCKYISLNSIVQTKVDRFYDTYMRDKKTIGIHMRGTDKYTEDKPVPTENVIAEALKYADESTQFFIATDEKKLFVEMFNLLRGKKVVYYDCYRSEDGKPLHLKSGPSKRKPSRAQFGEDVIVEMWLMSKCDMLIHTLSNVSSIPLYLNPKLKHVILR